MFCFAFAGSPTLWYFFQFPSGMLEPDSTWISHVEIVFPLYYVFSLVWPRSLKFHLSLWHSGRSHNLCWAVNHLTVSLKPNKVCYSHKCRFVFTVKRRVLWRLVSQERPQCCWGQTPCQFLLNSSQEDRRGKGHLDHTFFFPTPDCLIPTSERL